MSLGDLDRRSLLHSAGVVVLVAVLVPFLVFAAPQVAGAEHSYVVLSSSMSPTIHAGDVVIVNEAPAERIEQGDVITYERPGSGAGSPDRVTHRVVEVVERDDGRYFRTKGDANEEPDGKLVPAENLVGKVAFSIPYIGHVISFASSDAGILLFVVVPSVLFVISEVYDLIVAARGGSE